MSSKSGVCRHALRCMRCRYRTMWRLSCLHAVRQEPHDEERLPVLRERWFEDPPHQLLRAFGTSELPKGCSLTVKGSGASVTLLVFMWLVLSYVSSTCSPFMDDTYRYVLLMLVLTLFY